MGLGLEDSRASPF